MIKVVPYSYGLEEDSQGKKYSLVGIEEMSITYTQEADTCSSADEVQRITLTTQCPCAPSKKEAEKKQCFYFNVTIPEGEHWSINDGEELKALVEDFERRIYLEESKRKENK